MQLEDELSIEAPPGVVRTMLLDPDVLRRCIPGCEELERTSDTDYTAKVVLKVGPVKARFSGDVSVIQDEVTGQIHLTGKGSGGVAGFAKGSADVLLHRDAADSTRLTYVAQVDVGGRLAQLGNRLLNSTARNLTIAFFDAFIQEIADSVSA
ncbi:hypothetical protein SAMN04490248_104212 [Salinihabitans flavidus]|uniref:Carbon monoxide dehydrogenase subunit G n=1 Tax=Salinihabitans flavidus TaxID=569882 RepID=A0A1H8PAP8_9RHOB|nr:carbon monoxide dehydrogenase subunit G [Salinihabitans flavidus]SEO39002.1 hypothetical protein SAMN04490248_104212 [Salinihabitans flavidus]